MGRIIVEELVSADGFAAGPFGSLARLPPPETPGHADPCQMRMLATVDAILLGRATYHWFADHWPARSADEAPVSEYLNRLPKHVASNTLTHAPWGAYGACTVEAGDPRDTAWRLRDRYEGDIVVWGSLTLVGGLLQARQVDQLRLRIVPVLLGEGTRLAPGLRDARTMTPVEVDTHPSGHVTLVYDLS